MQIIEWCELKLVFLLIFLWSITKVFHFQLDDHALDHVMKRLFKNYKKWCKYLDRNSSLWWVWKLSTKIYCVDCSFSFLVIYSSSKCKEVCLCLLLLCNYSHPEVQATKYPTRSATTKAAIYGPLPSYLGWSCKLAIHARVSLLYLSSCELSGYKFLLVSCFCL